jgi:gp16 family phage-associated protein
LDLVVYIKFTKGATMESIKTPEQVKREFHAQGRTFAEWARANGYNAHEVYFILNGQRKGKWGRGHDIAVALGIKAKLTNEPDQITGAEHEHTT